MERMYGNDEMKVSVPGTFLVDKNGLVKNVYMETDWHRPETRAALGWMMLGGGKLRGPEKRFEYCEHVLEEVCSQVYRRSIDYNVLKSMKSFKGIKDGLLG
jgi:hypothetical protein